MDLSFCYILFITPKQDHSYNHNRVKYQHDDGKNTHKFIMRLQKAERYFQHIISFLKQCIFHFYRELVQVVHRKKIAPITKLPTAMIPTKIKPTIERKYAHFLISVRYFSVVLLIFNDSSAWVINSWFSTLIDVF